MTDFESFEMVGVNLTNVKALGYLNVGHDAEQNSPLLNFRPHILTYQSSTYPLPCRGWARQPYFLEKYAMQMFSKASTLTDPLKLLELLQGLGLQVFRPKNKLVHAFSAEAEFLKYHWHSCLQKFLYAQLIERYSAPRKTQKQSICASNLSNSDIGPQKSKPKHAVTQLTPVFCIYIVDLL